MKTTVRWGSVGLLGIFSLAGCSGEGVGPAELYDDSEFGIEDEAIWQGTVAPIHGAVVELRRYNGQGVASSLCTGQFITKRHIVTSAHCTTTAATQLYQVMIKTAAGSFVKLNDPARVDTLVALTQTRIPGYVAHQEVRDIAILTVSAAVAPSVPAAVNPIRLSTGAQTAGTQASIWGWGIAAPAGAAPRDLFVGKNSTKISISSVSTDGTYKWFKALVNTDARTCEGDSGGPATRVIGGNYVSIGAAAGARDPQGNDRPGCALSGDTMGWTAVSDKATWIESVLKVTYGAAFTCTKFGAAADAYMKCF